VNRLSPTSLADGAQKSWKSRRSALRPVSKVTRTRRSPSLRRVSTPWLGE
jgi:hypothetical protein